jgi:Uma2 family endonuclease
VCTKQRYGITEEDFQVLCAYSSIHKCELLLSVYLHARSGTSVKELILITYLWSMHLTKKGGLCEGGEYNNLCERKEIQVCTWKLPGNVIIRNINHLRQVRGLYMAMQHTRQHMSLEQYLLLVTNSDRRYEYYDGDVSLLAGGSSNHAAIALNFGVALDQALGDDAVCRPYVTDKLVRVASTKIVIPDVVVSCDPADHVVEVLSKSTEMTDRFVKLALYQAKESIQEIVYISQVIQRVEILSRSDTGWLYQQYGSGQSFRLESLDIEIEIRQLYRRLSIPAVIEQVQEENE